jgi:hypothetical protein
MLNIGQRDALSRLTHLLCEFVVRSRAVGLVDGGPYELSMTQGELADATGISTVHVNQVSTSPCRPRLTPQACPELDLNEDLCQDPDSR